MKKSIKLFVAFLLIITAFAACNQVSKEKHDKFVFNGTIEGMSEGEVILNCSYGLDFKSQTAIIENGKFTFTGSLAEPTTLFLKLDGNRQIEFYAENTNMAIKLHKDSLYASAAKITGGQFQADANKLEKIKIDTRKKYDTDRISKESIDRNISNKRKAENYKLRVKCREEIALSKENFIKENPASSYSAVLLAKIVRTEKKYEVIEKALERLDPSLDNCPVVVHMRNRVTKMKSNEVSVGNLISAENVSYKMDETFGGKQHTGVVYLGIFENDNLCCLKDDGSVLITNSSGQKLNSFKTTLKWKPSSVAVDKANNIYVLCCKQREVTTKIRGKVYKKYFPDGVECCVYNQNGEEQNRFEVSGLLAASGARVVDNKLIISDSGSMIIGICDAKTGKLESKINEMRSCCGILDFSISDKNEILVANIGAFKVEAYDLTGKKQFSLGKRGKELNDFQGCCNPVSVAYLTNGAIVTVEKQPTRVKVFSKEGAKQIMGIEELVKGCLHIPMTVDSKDNLYLASAEKGLVKCVSAM